MTVTNHMLRQKIAEINRQTRYLTQNNPGTNVNNVLDEEGTVLLIEKQITAIQGDQVITEDNQKAKLYNPIPGIHWKCMNKPDNNGKMILRKKLSGLFIDDGTSLYCLGLSGVSDEFEIRLQVGTNEIRLNDLFLNVNTQHLVVNGLEEKR